MLAGRMLFRYQILCFKDAERDASETLQYLLSCFLDIGLPDLGEHPGCAPLGFFICFRSPVNICTFLDPRSLRLISGSILLAAFRAACFGRFPVNTPISLPSPAPNYYYLAHIPRQGI